MRICLGTSMTPGWKVKNTVSRTRWQRRGFVLFFSKVFFFWGSLLLFLIITVDQLSVTPLLIYMEVVYCLTREVD